MGQALTPDPSRNNIMTTPRNRYTAIGLCGRQSDEGNELDSFIKTYEINLKPVPTIEIQDTGIVAPTGYLQVISAFIVVENSEDGLSPTVSIGLASSDELFNSSDVSNPGVIEIESYSPIAGGGNFKYKLSGADFSTLKARVVITVVGYDLDED